MAETGELYCPWWYPAIRASKETGGAVPPWRWFKRREIPPIARDRQYWMEAANAAATAESKAQAILYKQQTKS